MTKLLKVKLTSYKNSLLYGEDKKKNITGLLFYLALVGGILYLLISRVPRNQTLNPTVQVLVTKGLQVGFLIALFYLLIGGINTALKALYLEEDLTFLQALPISTRSVFTYKFISSWIDNSTILFLIAIPVLVAYGIYFGAPVAYYAVMLVGLSAFTALTTGVAALLTLVAAKFTPPERLQRVLQALGALVGAILYGVYYLNFYRGGSGSTASSNQFQLLKSIFTHPAVKWQPGGWLASALSYFPGQVTLTMFLAKFALLLAAAAAIFWTSRSLLMSAFTKGVGEIRTVPGQKQKEPAGSPVQERSQLTPIRKLKTLSPPFWAVAKKEFITYKRDLQLLSRLFFPLTVSIVLPIVMFTRSRGIINVNTHNLGLANLINSSFGLVAAWFLLFVVGSQISLFSFFSEKGNTAGTFSSPLAGERLVLIKTLTYFVPTIIFAEIYHIVGSILRGVDLKWLLAGVVALPLASFGMNSIGVSVAAGFGDPDVDDPRKSIQGSWRWLILPISIIYLGVTGIGLISVLYPESIPYLDYFGQFIRHVGGGLLFFLVTLGASFFSIRLAGNRLRHREW